MKQSNATTYEQYVLEVRDPVLLSIDKAEVNARCKELCGYQPSTLEFIKNVKEGGCGETTTLILQFKLTTKQERQVWKYMCKGLKGYEIANKMGLSPARITQIMAKIESSCK